MIEKIFKLKENKTNVKTEFIAGFTTFMTIAYIIFVNPKILAHAGMDYTSVYFSTIIVSAICTLLMGLIANVPYALSTGIGLSSLFTYTLCGVMGYSWQEALAIMFICGLINVIVTITNVRKKIILAIPNFLQEAITIGIGLYITYIGLIDANILSFSADSLINGFAVNVVPSLNLNFNPSIILTIVGIVITLYFSQKNIKGSYLISILITTLIGIPLRVTSIPNLSNYSFIPSFSNIFLKFDFASLFSVKSGILVVIMTIFTISLSDLFDSMGIFIGTGKKSGIFKMSDEGKIPRNLEKAMFVDSLGLVIGAMFGTSSSTIFIESSSGIEEGGRTGLTSVFIALLFLLCIVLGPIIECVPFAAVAPVLILIGASMIENIGSIDWKDSKIALPAFFTIIMMPFSYSITTGIEFGLIIYVIVNLINNKYKDISKIIYLFTILFILKYILQFYL